MEPSEKARGLNLMDLLQRPMKRVVEITGMIKILLKDMDEKDVDHPLFLDSLDLNNGVIELMEDKKKNVESIVKLIDLQSTHKLDGIVAEWRKIIHECHVTELVKNKVEDRNFLLLNDILVITSKKKGYFYNLLDICVTDLPDSGGQRYIIEIQVVKGKEKKKICFSSGEEKNKLIHSINEAQMNAHNVGNNDIRSSRASFKKEKTSILSLFKKKKSENDMTLSRMSSMEFNINRSRKNFSFFIFQFLFLFVFYFYFYF